MHGMSPEKTLQYLGLADYAVGRLQLRRAALLLFAKDISKWHPKCSVRIMVINGTEFKTGRDYNVRTDEQVEGNILTLVNKAWEQWRPHLVRTALDDGRFTDKIAYPDDACREALVNALTHRDYSMEGKGVEIRVFDDRMEIRSPGTLLSTITFDQLNRQTGVHDSRNAYIARVLREAGYVREMGEGIQRIFSLMSASELTAPQFEPKDGNFCVTLSHGSIFSEKDLAWLAGYRKLNLTSDEKLVVMLGRGGNHLSSQLIFDRLRMRDWDKYREFHERLLAKGVIYRAVPREVSTKLATQKRVKHREINRFAVRSPRDIERGLEELFLSLSRSVAVEAIGPAYVGSVCSMLPNDNIYRTNQSLGLFRALGLVDDDGRPLESLEVLWQKGTAKADGGDLRPSGTRRDSPPKPPKTGASTRQQFTGTIKWFSADLGYGFIVSDHDGTEIFVHRTGLAMSANPDDLGGGQGVHYEVETEAGRPRATNVRVAN